jgi:hypothetical protein
VIAVGELGIFRADERLARDFEERIENMPIGNPSASQLSLDHRLALSSEVR